MTLVFPLLLTSLSILVHFFFILISCEFLFAWATILCFHSTYKKSRFELDNRYVCVIK